MQRYAFVTGADRGLGFALTASLLEKGWHVFAGQYMPSWPDLAALAERHPDRLTILPLDVSKTESVRAAAQKTGEVTDHVDLVINNAGVISFDTSGSIRETQDYTEIHRVFDINALGALRVVEAFLPLTDRSSYKRLCFVSSEAGSIGKCERTSWYGYCMSKAALNMSVKILFNHLRPEGYTFRLYHPGWMRTYMSGTKNLEATLEPEEAAAYALSYFLADRDAEGNTFDEDHLVLRDYLGQEWPW